jgi:menaquinone-dependent protoporphyrinogen oxidase
VEVLIAYGTKRGGTAGLAEMIGRELAARGLGTTIQPARQVASIEGFDAVVLAGSLYATRWNKDAVRSTRRHAAALRGKPVWLVSSGPLDETASEGEIAPVRQVADAMASIGARGQVTFGGRLEPTAKGFPARAMARTRSGDWRDPDHVRKWAADIAEELRPA